MANPSIQNFPVLSQPFLYVNGLELGINATNPLIQIDIESGQCRDKNNVIDIVLSNGVTADITINGVNGLDEGTVIASTWYAVYMIADSSEYKPTCTIISLYSNSTPLMPLGYDSYKYIGSIQTDVSSNIIPFTQFGFESTRFYQWDSNRVVLNAGHATAFTNFNLINGMPPADQPAYLVCGFTPTADGEFFSMRAAGVLTAAGNCKVELTGPTTSVRALLSPIKAIPGILAGNPTMQYILQSGSSALDVYVNGWEESI